LLDTVADESGEYRRHKRLAAQITRQSFIILALTIVVIVFVPLTKPVYRYYAMTPQHTTSPLVPLSLPNLTNKAILSWAATSVTEIMTYGFGDLDAKLLAQKSRFTHNGWEAFVKAFTNMKIDEQIRKQQQVLTTVPSDTPVMVSQGENLQHVYEWHVQMPVVMTYATNNNVTRPERGVIELTISRVPYEQNASGIAIDSWKQKPH